MSAAWVAGLGTALGAQAPAAAHVLQIWHQGPSGGFQAEGGAPDAPLRAGSLQKPFVAKAWAQAHEGLAPPVLACTGGDACWFRAGHGRLDLGSALARSCNAYFQTLALDTPPEALRGVFLGEGFLAAPLSASGAIGLPDGHPPVTIRPSRLLEAYARLASQPWAAGEPLRAALLQGLREGALSGTASGVGHRGFLAKTGTVPSPEGHPGRTVGLALVVDPSGFAVLARRTPGTGREAAAALAGPLDRLRPGAPRNTLAPVGPSRGSRAPRARDPFTEPVRVRLFELLALKAVRVRNLGPEPIPCGAAFLGPGAEVDLEPGMTVGPGSLALELPRHHLRRDLQGAVQAQAGPWGRVQVTATLSPRDYVAGVLHAELPGASGLRTSLGAAVLRFLARGPRHGEAAVCDSTHCAWFVGRGPRVDWRDPRRARALPGAAPAPLPITDEAWLAMTAEARRPGPSQWTSHCGGRPLSSRAVWGRGEGTALACARHAQPGPAWTRTWPLKAVARAFGPAPAALEVRQDDGPWSLRIQSADQTRDFPYDEVHRRIAAELGWDALPSPADRVEPVPGGFRVQGVGAGHRVGLCLGE